MKCGFPIRYIAVIKEESFLSHQVLTSVTVGSANRPAACGLYSGLLTPETTTLTEESIYTVYQGNHFKGISAEMSPVHQAVSSSICK